MSVSRQQAGLSNGSSKLQERQLSSLPSAAIGASLDASEATEDRSAIGLAAKPSPSSFSLPSWMVPLVGPLALLSVWALVNATGIVSPKLLPSPLKTIDALATDLVQGGLAFDLGQSALRTLKAFALAIATGLPLGIIIGSSRRTYRAVEFLIDFFRSTPATALFPLFMIILGLGDISKIAVAAFSAFLIILFNVAYGVMNATPTRRLAARLMGASRLRVFRDVTIFESLPQTFVGLRTAVSLALVIVIVAEMFIGSDSGLGKRIIDAQITFDMPSLYGTILLTGALGYAFNLSLFALERRLVHWAGR